MTRDLIEACLAENFTPELLDELDAVELRELADLLKDGNYFLPSGSAARRFLGYQLHRGMSAINSVSEEQSPAFLSPAALVHSNGDTAVKEDGSFNRIFSEYD